MKKSNRPERQSLSAVCCGRAAVISAPEITIAAKLLRDVGRAGLTDGGAGNAGCAGSEAFTDGTAFGFLDLSNVNGCKTTTGDIC